ncbi:MAG: hypothetical protein M1546_00390 [Chloroflexi bacterium]|nr:hypothetical protein [Chloroflexota bacterium]
MNDMTNQTDKVETVETVETNAQAEVALVQLGEALAALVKAGIGITMIPQKGGYSTLRLHGARVEDVVDGRIRFRLTDQDELTLGPDTPHIEIESFEVGISVPDVPDEANPRLIHIVIRLHGIDAPLVFRIKSKLTVDSIIDLLQSCRDDVYGPDTRPL